MGLQKIVFLLLGLSLNAQISGKIITKQGFERGGNIYTRNITTNNDTIITRGGVIGLKAETVSDTPQLRLNQLGTFYVDNDKELLYIEESERLQPITSVTPSIVKGGIKQIITISGSNFGERSSVEFSNANFGGALFTPVLDSQIVSWTDTQIEVEVPDFAGSGAVRVKLADGTNLDSNNIIVDYSLINIAYQGTEYLSQHVNDNSNGGYTWQFNTSFNEQQRDAFKSAFDTWTCNTEMNWVIGEDTDVNVVANDGVNVIAFTNPGSGVLGRCTTRYSGCFENGIIKWYITELDIEFNVNITWEYGNINEAGYNFKTVALHELGHGHGLAHVVDESKVMHYSLNSSTIKLELEQSSLDAGAFIQDINTNTSVCGVSSLEPLSCSLSTPTFETNKIVLKTELYDIHGRLVTYNLSNGLYLKKITYIDGSFKVIKVIK